MKSVNKIRARDLDSDFLLEIFGSKTAGQLQSLLSDYLKKTDVINRNSLPSSYTQEVEGEIQEIKDDILDIQNDYRKKNVAISMDDLAKDVTDVINGMSYFLQSVRTEGGNTLIAETSTGKRSIRVIDSTGEVLTVVLPDTYYERSDETVSLQLMADRVNQLQLRFTVLEETMKAVIKRLDGLPAPTIDVSLPYYPGGTSATLFSHEAQSSATTSSSTFTTDEILESDIRNFLYGEESSSLSFISNQIGTLQSSVRNLEGRFNAGIKRDNLENAVKNDLSTISNLSERVGNLEVTKMTEPTLDKSGYFYCNYSNNSSTISLRTIVMRALLCYNASEVSSAKTTTEPFIIDCAQSIIYNYNATTSDYTQRNLSELTIYDNLFVMDAITNVIEYIIVDGMLAKLNNGKSSATSIGASTISTRTVNIASNNSERIARINNLKKYPPTVLVYDNDASSRTGGRYVSNEGIVTVSHHTDFFEVHNDSDRTIEVLIIMGD